MVGQALALIADHLLGHRDLAEAELELAGAADVALRCDRVDEDHRLLLRLRVPVVVEGVDDRAARIEVELGDLVRAPEVQVDRPRVDRREGALRLDLAEHLARRALDDGDRVERRRAQGDLAGREARAARQVAPVAADPQLAGAHQRVGALAPAVAEDRVVGATGLSLGATEGRLEGGGKQVRRLDPLVRRDRGSPLRPGAPRNSSGWRQKNWSSASSPAT